MKKAFPKGRPRIAAPAGVSVAKMIGQTIRRMRYEDADRVEGFVQLSLMLAPVITLDEKLRAAADSSDSRGYRHRHPENGADRGTGLVRADRRGSHSRYRARRAAQRRSGTLESAFQILIQTSPWLVNPQWSPITANRVLLDFAQGIREVLQTAHRAKPSTSKISAIRTSARISS